MTIPAKSWPVIVLGLVCQISTVDAQAVIGMSPAGPVCMGPLGPGLCVEVQRYIEQQMRNAVSDITQGPGPNNWLLGRDGPVQRRTESTVDSINNGMGQVLQGRAPPPAVLGTVGGKRVCIPWC